MGLWCAGGVLACSDMDLNVNILKLQLGDLLQPKPWSEPFCVEAGTETIDACNVWNTVCVHM